MKSIYQRLVDNPSLYFEQPTIPLRHPMDFNSFSDQDADLTEIKEEVELVPTCPDREKLKEIFDNWEVVRLIKFGVAHTTETFENATVSGMIKYWKNTKKWGDVPGYSLVFTRDGGFTFLQDFNEVTYGVAGRNLVSLHFAWMGGAVKQGGKIVRVDNRTPKQKELMAYAFELLKQKCPNVFIQGHRDFPNQTKECPLFEAKDEYAYINENKL